VGKREYGQVGSVGCGDAPFEGIRGDRIPGGGRGERRRRNPGEEGHAWWPEDFPEVDGG